MDEVMFSDVNNIFQVQNLVAMVPFYPPKSALLVYGLIQELHKETIAHQSLITILTWRYRDISMFLFVYFTI